MPTEAEQSFRSLLKRAQPLPSHIISEHLQQLARLARKPITVFDFESTHYIVKFARITQVGIVHIPLDGSPCVIQALVNPERKISADATKISRITNEMVSGKPNWGTYWCKIFHWLASNHVTAGYNSKSYDCRLAQKMNAKFGYEGTQFEHHIDVMHLPEMRGRSLKHAIEESNFQFHGVHHSALTDAIATAQLLNEKIAQLNESQLHTAIQRLETGAPPPVP